MLNKRETAAVLAGLRTLQAARTHPYGVQTNTPEWTEIVEIATDGHGLEPLTANEIDALCERINCGGVL